MTESIQIAIAAESRRRQWRLLAARLLAAKGQVFVAVMVLGFAHVAMASHTGARTGGGHERTPGYLGIEFRETPEDEVTSLHLQKSHGAEIVMVDHDGPVGKAGLRPHDIVVQLNGLAVEGADGLKRMIHEAGAGASVALSVLREGHSMTLTAQLADREQVARQAWQQHMAASTPPPPEVDDPVVSGFVEDYTVQPPAAAPAPHDSFIGSMLRFGPYTGVMLGTMEPQLAGFFGVPNGKGLLVHSVEANSPAAVAGLKAGDVLLRADNHTLATASDWSRALRAGKGRIVALVIFRDRREQTLMLPLDLKKHSMVEWPHLFGQ